MSILIHPNFFFLALDKINHVVNNTPSSNIGASKSVIDYNNILLNGISVSMNNLITLEDQTLPPNDIFFGTNLLAVGTNGIMTNLTDNSNTTTLEYSFIGIPPGTYDLVYYVGSTFSIPYELNIINININETVIYEFNNNEIGNSVAQVNLNVQNNYSNNILTPNESKVSLETNGNIIFIDVLTDISITFIINQGITNFVLADNIYLLQKDLQEINLPSSGTVF